MRLVPVARHDRCGLLRTTALQAVALFGLAAVAAAPHAAAQPAPNARPQGGAVVGGSASISQSATNTTVKQSSARAALDWTTFDVGSKQTVTFTAPSPSDVTLNQVTGGDPSQIAGHVVANDQLVLVNRSGVVFSKGAEVDTAGLVVSASGIAAGAFMQGSATFDIAPRPGAKITNEGTISVRDHGLAALVAPQVANDGVITAKMGRVTLAGAEAHTIDLYGDGMLSINVTKQVTKASLGGQQVDALVTNSGLVRADGGAVTLTAQAVDGLVTTLVSAGGKVAADAAGGRAGTVLIDGVGGSVRVTGDVSAQAPNGGHGGQIEVNATQIASVAAGAALNASGAGGGGVIAVGTTLARAQGGSSVKPATTARGTLVEKGATLSADATGAGRGGKITVLSTQATVFEGAITARGGAQSGDGGSAEVSGAAGFTLTGTADLTSPHGAKGSLLIDPTDLDIVATGGNIDNEIGLVGMQYLLAAAAADAASPATSSVDVAKLATIGMSTDVTLQASKTITVEAAVSVGNGLTLQAGDALTVNAGATISAKNITLSAATASITGATTTGGLTVNAALTATPGGINLFAGSNGVSLNAAVAAAGVGVSTTGKLTLGSASSINVKTGTVDVSSVGGVAQDPASVITAGLLQSATGIAGAASFGGTANAISALGDVAFGSSFALKTVTPLTVQGAVAPSNGATGGNIQLSVGDGKGEALTIGGTKTQPGSLAVAAGYSISLSADAIAAGAGGAAVTIGTGGTIEIAPLTAGLDVSVNGTATKALDLPLASLGLSDGGAGGTLRIGAANGVTTAKNISFDGATDLSAFGGDSVLDVEASGSVAEAAGVRVAITALTGSAASLSLPTVTNAFSDIVNFTASGDISVTNAGPLSASGKISGTDVSLTVTQAGGAIVLDGGQGTVLKMTAASGGTITLTSDRLLSSGGATVSAPGGVVRIVPYDSEDVIVGGSMATIELPAITAATVSLGAVAKAASITFEAATDLGAASLDLETSGAATQANVAGVTAAGLTGSVGSLDFASPGATNAIAQIGPFTATAGALSLTTGGALGVTGAVTAPAGGIKLVASGGALTQSSGSIVAFDPLTLSGSAGVAFAGELSAPSVTLASSGGGIAETPSGTPTGTVVATKLSFTSGAAASFATKSGAGFGNQVATLEASTVPQGLVLADGRSLTLSGATTAQSASIAVDVAGGALALGDLTAASLTVGAGHALSLVADQLTPAPLLSSTLSAPNGVIQIAPYSTGVAMSVGGVSGAGVLGFKTGGGLGALTIDLGSGGTLRLGGAAGAPTAASIGFAAGLDLSGTTDTLDLESLGAVTQAAAAPVKVEFLTGKAGSLDLTAATTNMITTLNDFTATGSFKLSDDASLAVKGTVTAGASAADVIALTALPAGASVTLGVGSLPGALVATGGGNVTLQADKLLLGAGGGSISAPGAGIGIAPETPGTTMVVGGGAATVHVPTLTSAVLTLGKVGATTTAADITLSGVVAIGTAVLDLEGSGAVTQRGAVTAGTLTGNVGSLTLDTISNAIGTVGPLTAATAGISLVDSSTIILSGTVQAAGNLQLSSAGSITQASGTLSGAAGSMVSLQASGSILFGGKISGGSVVLHATGGAVSESPAGGADTGAVSATDLTALADAGAIDLTTPSGPGFGNQVGALGASKATGGAFSLVDGTGLTVFGTVTGTNVSVKVSPGDTLTLGTADLAGSLTALTGGVVSVTADGIAEAAGGGSLSAPGGTVEIAPATVGDAIAVGGVTAPGTLGISLLSLNFTADTLRLGGANGATTAGAITFVTATDLSAVGTLDLEAAGAVAQAASAPLSVATLTGAAASVDLSTAATNAIGALGGFTATGGFKLKDASSLTLAGTVKAGAAAGDQIALAVTQPGGTITFGSGLTPGVLSAGGGASVALQADGVLLGVGGSAISAPGAAVSIAPYDAVAMVVGGSAATVELPAITAASLTLGKVGLTTTATDISLAGGLALGAVPLDLEATGDVTQGAAVTAGALTGTVGSLTLGLASNAIASIGPITATQGVLTLTDGESLALGGPLVAKTNLSLTAKAGAMTPGDITLTRPLTAGGGITLVADGQVTQSGGALTGTTLLAKANAGQVLLNGTANDVGVLGASSATAGFTFEDDAALTVIGAVSGTSVTLTVNAAGQALTLGGVAPHIKGQAATLTATAVTDPTATLQADVVSLGAAGGSVTATDGAGDGLVQIAPFTAGTAFGTAAAPLQLPTFTTNTLRIGEVAGTVTAASILFASPVAVAGGTLDVEATGLVSQTAAGGATAAVLVGNVGTLDFLSAGAVNDIGALGMITATSGEIAVGDALNINISQSISAPSVLLTTGGTITQSAGAITATAANGAVDLTAGGTLSFGGAIVGPNVSLVSVLGDVTEALGAAAPTGVVRSTVLLTGSSGKATLLDTPSPAGAGNQVAQLGSFAATGGLTLANGEALTLAGNVSGAAVTLTVAGGSITQDAATSLMATGAAALTASSGISFSGVVGGASVSLTGLGGAVVEASTGVVDAGLLTGSAAGAASFGGAANQVAQLGGFTATGAFTLQDGEALAITGDVVSGGAVNIATSAGGITQSVSTTVTAATSLSLTSALGIAFGGTLDPGSVNLVAMDGDITETLPGQPGPTGVILASVLTGSAPNGSALLNTASPAHAGNQVGQLGAFAVQGAFELYDGEALTLVDDVSGASVTLLVNGVDGITQAAATTIAATGTVSLVSSAGIAFGGVIAGTTGVSLVAQDGDVTEMLPRTTAPTGVVQTALLTGSSTGVAAFGTPSSAGVGNQVAGLGPFVAGGTLTLVDGEGLAVVGLASSLTGDVSLTTVGAAADITVTSEVSARGSATLVAGGSIVSAGTVAAGGDATLTAVAGDITQSGQVTAGGSATLGAAGAIAVSGTVQAGSLATLAATAGDITQAGLVTAPALSETAGGSIDHSGVSVATGGPATLTAGGAISQDAGTIAATGGDVTLTASGGAITQRAGALISDASPAQTVALTSSAGIAFGGVISASGTASFVAQGGDVVETAPGQTAPTGVLLASLLTGSATGQASFGTASPAGSGNLVAQLGAFAAGGGLALLDGEALAVVGNVAAPGGVLLTTGAGGVTQAQGLTLAASGAGAVITIESAAGIAFGGTLSAPAGTVNLAALGGDVTETFPIGTVQIPAAPTGIVLAQSLIGSASGIAAFDTPSPAGLGNQVAQLGPFAAGGALTLQDGRSLAVVGMASSAAGDVALTANGPAADVTVTSAVSAAGAVTLVAGRSIDVPGTVQAGTAATLTAATGDIDEPGFVVAGGAATLNAAGSIVSAGTVQSGAAATLTAVAGDITQSGLVTATGPAALAAGGSIVSAGTVQSGADATLTAVAGDITQSGLVTATGAATFAAGGSIAATGTVQAGADATLTAATGIAQSGLVRAGGAATLSAGGSILTTGTVQAGTDAALTAAADIAQSGLVTAASSASLDAGGAIGVSGTVQAGTLASLAATAGDLTQAGLVTAPAVSETAGGSILHSGSSVATAGSATLAAGGAISQAAGTIMATGGDLTLTAAGGAITQAPGALIADASTGQTVALTASMGIAFGGVVSAAGTASLVAQGGDVTETAPGQTGPTGVLLANLLTGSATGQALFDTASPAGSGNLVAQLGAFTTGGALTLVDGEALALVGDVTAPGGFSLTTGVGGFTLAAGQTISAPAPGAVIAIDVADGIAFGGTLSAPAGTVSLTALGGDVTETAPGATAPTGVVVAQSLIGSASGTAAFDTPSAAGAGNLVANLGPFSTSGALTLLDGRSLTAAGSVVSFDGDVTLTAAGPASDLTVTGTLTAAASALLTAGGAIESAGTIQGGEVSLAAGAGITQPSGLILGGTGGTTLTAAGGSISQAPGAVVSDPPATISLAASGGIAFGGTITTAGTVSLAAAGGDITEVATGATAPTGVLLASSLTGSASGRALLSTPSPAGSGNLVAGLSAFATGGDFTLVDGQGLTVSGPLAAAAGATPGAVTITLNGATSDLVLQGPVTAAGPVALTAGGAISQASGTLLATDGAVTLTALGGDISQAAGAVVSDPAAGATVSLTASGEIAFAGAITTPGTVSLVATGGDVTEPESSAGPATGAVIAGLLTGSASGFGLFLNPSPAGGGNEVAALGPFTGGQLVLLDGRSLTVSGALASSGDLTLTTNGAASDLTVAAPVSAGAFATLTAASDLTVAAPVSAGAFATLTAGRTLIVTGSVRSGATASLSAAADIDQAGLVTAAVVSQTAGGAIVNAGDSVATEGTATLVAGAGISQPSGTIAATTGVSLAASGGSFTQSVAAVVSATGPVGVTASGGVAFGGLITTPGAVTLTARGGDVTETSGAAGPTGVLVASSLSGSASGQGLFDTASPSGAGNQVGAVGSFSTGGQFLLLDGEALAVAGPLTIGGALDVSVAGGLTLAGDMTAAGTGAFTAGAGITQSSGTVQAGGATLTLTAQGGSITQASGAVLSAPAAGAAITLAASDAITFGGTVAAPGSISLVASGGDATETGGVLQTASLTGAVHGQALLATASPAGSGNLVAQLGAFTAGGDLVLADGETLTASGAQTAADIRLTTAGSLAQAAGGTMTATGTLALAGQDGISFAGVLSAAAASLTAPDGPIVEATTGAARFGLLSGSAGQELSLAAASGPGAGNQVGQVGDLSAGGSLELQDGESLIVAGSVLSQSGPATIAVHGAGAGLTVTGSVGSSGAATLSTDGALTQAGSVQGAAVVETAGGDITQSGTSTATTAVTLAAGGAISVAQGGSLSAGLGDLALTAGGAGGIAFGGTLSTGQQATLTASAGGIAETAPGAASPTGQLTAPVLSVSAAGPVMLDGPDNQIGQVLAFASAGSLTLANAAALTIGGPLSVPGGALSLTAGGSGLTVAGPVTASSADLVATSGDVTESGAGLLTLDRLTGSAAGSASFGAANRIAALGPFATGAGFSLTDAGALSVTASVSAPQGPVAIATGGGLTQTAGTVSGGAGGATLVAGGAFSQSAGAALADADPATGVAVTAQGMALGGDILAAGAPVTLIAQGGAILQVGGGAIRAGSLSGSATGAATFGDEAGNQVARLGSFSSGGAFQLLDGTALIVSGPLAGQTVDLETPGAVTLAGARISAALVPGATQYAALLAPTAAPPGAADGIYIKASSVTATGVTTIDPGAPVQTNPALATNASTPGPVLSIVLAGGKGTVSFAELDSPAVQLFVSLGDGGLSGAVDVAGLHVATSQAADGAATLTGVVAGQIGTSAAGVADIQPLRNSRYEINACPLGSVNCILLSPILVPITNPVQDVEVSGVGTRQDDPDLILPNVGEQDF